jgi:C1A family cysteine protease
MSAVNHGVVAVGWGVDVDAVTEVEREFWLLKNSWGTRWGLDNGYIKIERNSKTKTTEDNACAVLELNSFPEF